MVTPPTNGRTKSDSKDAGKPPVDAPRHAGFSEWAKCVPFLACLTDHELQVLARIVVEKQLDKDDVVLYEEESSKFFYLLYSGKVKAVRGDPRGQEQILAIHKQGEFFGEVAILDGKTSPATVIAMEETELGLIAAEDFRRLLLSKPKVMEEILTLLCSRMREFWMNVKLLGFTDAALRVRSALHILSRKVGTDDESGNILLPELTHRKIAHLASLARETVTRQLQELRRSEEIEILPSKKILLRPRFFRNSPIP